MSANKFRPRRCSDGSWGVWDGELNAWRDSGRDAQTAALIAADMGIDHVLRTYGFTHLESWRPLEPAMPVEVLITGCWQAGRLTEWRRHPEGAWWGHVVVGGAAEPRWFVATLLRDWTP